MMFKQKIGITVIVCVSALLSACSTVEYVSNRDVIHTKSASFAQDYSSTAGKQFGALVFKSKDNKGKLDEGRAFVIRKNKSEYVAETMLVDSSLDEKATFKKSYLSFGADKKKGMMGFTLRFVY